MLTSIRNILKLNLKLKKINAIVSSLLCKLESKLYLYIYICLSIF